jgi:predicted methyltransferase
MPLHRSPRLLVTAAAVLLGLNSGLAAAALDKTTAAALDAALSGDHRSAENRARDVYRKPREVLDFLGLRSDMTVVELSPGTGWYTQVLAPALKDNGRYYAANYGLAATSAYARGNFGKFMTMLSAHPDLYGKVNVTQFQLPYETGVAPRGSADMVLTFRNVHNWAAGDYGALAFRVMFDTLKPGGVLGIVDHRWPDPKTEDPLAKNGYISEERTIALAEAAGFKLAARSEVLRNPKDDHDHPEGVWTLPPVLRLGDKDREQYLAIGESDRFLLKFVKP